MMFSIMKFDVTGHVFQNKGLSRDHNLLVFIFIKSVIIGDHIYFAFETDYESTKSNPIDRPNAKSSKQSIIIADDIRNGESLYNG